MFSLTNWRSIMPHTCRPVVSWFILPPSFVLLCIKAGCLLPGDRTMSHKGESSKSPAGDSALGSVSSFPLVLCSLAESGQCLFSLDPKTGSSSYIADCSSRLANNLVLKIYVPVSSTSPMLFLISSQLFSCGFFLQLCSYEIAGYFDYLLYLR